MSSDDQTSGDQTPGAVAPDTGEEVFHHSGGNLPAHTHHDEEILEEDTVRQYWRTNIRLLSSLLVIWFVVSFGFSILFIDEMNAISFFGFKFGFWWAQQGAILVFVVLIFVYALAMKRIDRRFGVDDD